MSEEREKYGSYEVPDAIAPVVGVRAWVINKDLRNEERLFSIYKTGVPWPPGDVLEAKCIQPGSVWAGVKGANMWVHTMRAEDPIKKLPVHEAPYLPCNCGVYALNSTLNEGEVRPWITGAVVGIVLLWGRVETGNRGWRGQYAKIAALLVANVEPSRVQTIQRMADLYQVPVITDLVGELEKQKLLQGGMLAG